MNTRFTKNRLLIAVLVTCMGLAAGTTALASVFNTIDFEASEGYAAPQGYIGVHQRNITDGPDFKDTYYGSSGGTASMAVFTWDGTWPGGGVGVAHGNSVFFYDADWQQSYIRTGLRPVPVERQADRYFTIDFSAIVGYAVPGPSDVAPPYMHFWFNGLENNGIVVRHSWLGEAADSRKITLGVFNGTSHDIFDAGDYIYSQWVEEKLVLDRELSQATYYYNGAARLTFSIVDIESWQNYGLSYAGSSKGWIATDNLRFGTDGSPVPEPSALFALGTGLTGLLGVVSRRRK